LATAICSYFFLFSGFFITRYIPLHNHWAHISTQIIRLIPLSLLYYLQLQERTRVFKKVFFHH
jgi:hypothetical protein